MYLTTHISGLIRTEVERITRRREKRSGKSEQKERENKRKIHVTPVREEIMRDRTENRGKF